jgi:hypothetical protein
MNEKITRADFKKYEKARHASINMVDIKAVELFTKLPVYKIMEIRLNFKKYYDVWSDLAEEFGETW